MLPQIEMLLPQMGLRLEMLPPGYVLMTLAKHYIVAAGRISDPEFILAPDASSTASDGGLD